MADLEQVLVLAGGLSPERDVSLRSGHQVAEALREAGLTVDVRDVDAGLLPWLAAEQPQVVFPVLHGAPGEDGTLQEVLRMAGVAFVGAGPEGARLAFDKPVAKTLLRGAGLHVPASVTLPRQAFHDLGAAALADHLIGQLGLPLCVKPRAGGSAFGVSRVTQASELPAALMTCFGYHEEALVEEWIVGTEIAVGVLDLGDGPIALPAVEIVPDGGFYDYTSRYTAGATQFFTPARLSDQAAAEAATAAIAAHTGLGLRHLSRTDIIVTADQVPYLLETNVAPGMTETSTFPLALQANAYDFSAVCRDLVLRAAAAG